jgi:hypothetical protein
LDQNHDYEHTCTQYLLGELTEAEQTQFEETYFVDDLLFERFLAVKDDLVDSYARDELAGRKRERFEQHFLANQPRRERVNNAKEFIRAVSALPSKAPEETATTLERNLGSSRRQSFLRLFAPGRIVTQGALAFVLLLAVAGSLVLIKRMQRERAEQLQKESFARNQKDEKNAVGPVPLSGANIQGQRESVVNSQPTPATIPASPLPNPNKPSPPLPSRGLASSVASLSLMPFSPRQSDSAPISLKLGPETRLVRLSLIFKDDDYRSYEITMRTVAGEPIVHRRGLRAQTSTTGKSVTLALDPSIFSGQDYIITLNGLTAAGKLEPLNDYYLRVERNPR